LEFVSPIVAVIALIVSVISALAAYRSAKAAEDSAAFARRTLDRLAIREVVTAAHEVLAEASRIDSLAEELRQQYRTLFAFAGQFGGSSQQLYAEQLDEKQQRATELSQESRRLTADLRLLKSASENDLTQMSGRLDAALSKLRPMREGLEREVADIAAQNDTYREERIKKR
jgi:phage-related tail protein